MYDADTYQLLGATRAGTFPALMAVARPAGQPAQLWVTNFSSSGSTDHAVRVLDPSTLAPITQFTVPSHEQPHGLAISADQTRAYVTNILTSNVTIFGTDPPRVIEQNIVLPNPSPGGADPQQCIISPDGTRLFVSALKHDRVYVLDTASLEWTAEIVVGDGPWHLTLSPDATRLWVANWLGSSLSIVDVTNPDAPSVLVQDFRVNHPRDAARTVIQRPIGIAFSPDGSRVWVANANDDNQGAGHHPAPEGEKNPGSVAAIDPNTFAVIHVAEVPNFARFLTFLP
jgi:YVTN family beta-propeller protein